MTMQDVLDSEMGKILGKWFTDNCKSVEIEIDDPEPEKEFTRTVMEFMIQQLRWNSPTTSQEEMLNICRSRLMQLEILLADAEHNKNR